MPSVDASGPGNLPLAFQSASEMLARLHAKQISAVELLNLHLARVREVNPALNAVVAINEDDAMAQAKRADAALAKDRWLGALHGLPMTIKDAFEVVGMPATCGFAHLKDHRPGHDAEVVTLLRRAGAVIFGKTNVPEGAGDHQTYNAVYGLTRNPWNAERSAGGSSGGAAVAVAAGLSPLDIGSDIGGSIRCPAHFNGIFGHKASHSIVPLAGHIPPLPPARVGLEMGVAGPLARNALDLELAMNVIAAPGMLDRKGKRWKLPPARRHSLEEHRVAVLFDVAGAPVDGAYRDALERYVDALHRVGVRTTRLAAPPIDATHALDVYFDLLFGLYGGGAPEPIYEAFKALATDAAPSDRSFAARMGRAARLTARDWLARLEERDLLCRRWEHFFADHDIVLCPVMSTIAFPHDLSGVDHTAQLQRTVKIDGRDAPYLINLAWPGLITVANLPSTAMPTGQFVDGMPVGIQAVGPYLEDRTTLRFAALVQQRLGGYTVPSSLEAAVAMQPA
jgi:amidase